MKQGRPLFHGTSAVSWDDGNLRRFTYLHFMDNILTSLPKRILPYLKAFLSKRVSTRVFVKRIRCLYFSCYFIQRGCKKSRACMNELSTRTIATSDRHINVDNFHAILVTIHLEIRYKAAC